MKETIIIIIFISIVYIFITFHKTEVTYEESFIDNEVYLVRNLKDKKDAADLLATLKKKLKKLIYYVHTKAETDRNNRELSKYKKYVKKILDNIDTVDIKESSPNSKFTSYSINKGEEIVFCLRSKISNKLHDINELMYVAVHEIAHIGNPEVGHDDLFHAINKFLLKQAVEIGLYKYRDYAVEPVEYCGMTLTSTILNSV